MNERKNHLKGEGEQTKIPRDTKIVGNNIQLKKLKIRKQGKGK